MEYQKMSYAALENNYRTQRKSAHEFERHLQTLGDLMGEGAYDTALEYVQKLRNSRSRAAAIRTGHPVFDVILNQKYQLGAEYRFSYENGWFSFAADFPLECVMVQQAT